MSLINREDLLQTLGITDMDCEKCGWYSRTARRCRRGSDFEDACCAIDDAPEVKPEPKWIPTSKKPDPDLPEEDMSGYFLVTLHTYGNIGFDMDEYEVKKMRWNRVNGWVLPVHSPAWIEDALTQDVLAWKPCPEPYREEGE